MKRVEVVDVEQNERQISVRRLLRLKQRFEPHLQEGTVLHAGQRVHRRPILGKLKLSLRLHRLGDHFLLVFDLQTVLLTLRLT